MRTSAGSGASLAQPTAGACRSATESSATRLHENDRADTMRAAACNIPVRVVRDASRGEIAICWRKLPELPWPAWSLTPDHPVDVPQLFRFHPRSKTLNRSRSVRWAPMLLGSSPFMLVFFTWRQSRESKTQESRRTCASVKLQAQTSAGPARWCWLYMYGAA